MYAQLCGSANEIFTSVVVYSRTTNKKKKHPITQVLLKCLELMVFLRGSIIFRSKKRKKNGAHTNSCTTVRLDERNIHVGCCLFSHIHLKKINKKKKK